MQIELGGLIVLAAGVIFNAGTSWLMLNVLWKWKGVKDVQDAERDRKIAVLESVNGL